MCSKSRTKKHIVCLAVMAVAVGCTFSLCVQLRRHYAAGVTVRVLYSALNVVLPLTVLIINVLLMRELRRASRNAAANLGLHHLQSTSSQSAVPTVMLVTTSLVYVALLETHSALWLAYVATSSLVLYPYVVISGALSRLVYAYNFFVYLITGKQFRSDLRTIFCRHSSSSSSSSSAVVVYNRNDDRIVGLGRE